LFSSFFLFQCNKTIDDDDDDDEEKEEEEDPLRP
jgi:hypothetical protein